MKNTNNKDLVYVAMRGDLINSGHINILTKASSLGRVVVGLLSDEAIESYKKGPFLKYESRFITINEILEVTTKPIIYDGDTGGLPEHFRFMVKNLERAGVSAVIIEDKIGLKRNSLFGTEAQQTQDSIENFCNKIITGKNAALTNEFMVIARIESLILEQGLNDALIRAKAYIEAGSDGILIHSRKKDGKEVFV